MVDSSGYDLTEYQDEDNIKDLFGKLISGKAGYETVIDKTKEIPKCESCGNKLVHDEKFCPECGTKVEEKNG